MNLSYKETIDKIKLYQSSRFKRVKSLAEKICENDFLNRLLLKEVEKLEKEEIKKEFYKKFSEIKKFLLILQKRPIFSKYKELKDGLKEVEHNLKIIENNIDDYRSYLVLMYNTEQKIVSVYQEAKKRV